MQLLLLNCPEKCWSAGLHPGPCLRKGIRRPNVASERRVRACLSTLRFQPPCRQLSPVPTKVQSRVRGRDAFHRVRFFARYLGKRCNARFVYVTRLIGVH